MSCAGACIPIVLGQPACVPPIQATRPIRLIRRCALVPLTVTLFTLLGAMPALAQGVTVVPPRGTPVGSASVVADSVKLVAAGGGFTVLPPRTSPAPATSGNTPAFDGMPGSKAASTLSTGGGSILPTPPRLSSPPHHAPLPVVVHVRLSQRLRAAVDAAPDAPALVAHLLNGQGNTLAVTPMRNGSTLAFLVEPSELSSVRKLRVRAHPPR